jgi:uroporphyrinogen decarboxylase
MNSRERIHGLISRTEVDRCGFWLGNPDPASWQLYYDYFGTRSQEEIRGELKDDVRWITPQDIRSSYRDVENKEMFLASIRKDSHGQAGPLADCEDVAEVASFKWPDARQVNLDEALDRLRNAGDVYRLSGWWTCFYHNCMDLFGMEDYMIKMYTHPEVVHAVTDRVCEFYYEANERFFSQAGDLADGFFFGNDFGTQNSLICGPDQFAEFILPWFRRFTAQGHDHGYQVVLHSCGAIHRVIESLIESGVDCLHPLQAGAAQMDAETLARDFGGRITFLGGVDTQDLLIKATPDQVKAEVDRLKKILGPYLIVSPSHEALLPDVPPENVRAMAEAATQQ